MNSSLLALIELAAIAKAGAPLNDDVSTDTLYPELVAPIMRYEMLLKQRVQDEILGHVNGLTKEDMIKCKELYTGDYLIGLSIPYSGITELCIELVTLCRGFGLDVPDVWQRYADGAFDWDADIAFMTIQQS